MELPISAVLEDAELLTSGDFAPSKLLPYVFGIMTRMAPLAATIEAAKRVRQFGDGPLPDKEELFKLLKGTGLPFFGDAADAVYRMEQVIDDSWLDMGETLEEQREFRRDKLKKSKGMRPKTLTMAMMLYLGRQCWVIPVDRWHLRLLGMPEHSPKEIDLYESIENQIIQWVKDNGLDSEPYGMGGWLRWERGRQAAGASLSPEYGVKVESHAELSIRRR